jgi:hypothetical protein
MGCLEAKKKIEKQYEGLISVQAYLDLIVK